MVSAVRHCLELRYALLGALATPGDFPVVLIVGFMINGLQFAVNGLTQFPVAASTQPHLHLVRVVTLTGLYKRHKYPAPPTVPR